MYKENYSAELGDNYLSKLSPQAKLNLEQQFEREADLLLKIGIELRKIQRGEITMEESNFTMIMQNGMDMDMLE